MQKWAILVIVALLGVMLGLQVLLNKQQPKSSSGAPAATAPMETASPEPVTNTAPPEFPQAETAVKSQSASVSPDGRFFQSACTGGAGLDAYVNAREGMKTLDALNPSRDVIEPMLEYFSCKAAAEGSAKLCDYLPDRLSGSESARSRCRAPLSGEFFFLAYVSGKSDADRPACLDFGRAWQVPDVEQFCDYARSVGMEKICEKSSDPRCRKMFPVQKSDCQNKDDCLGRFTVYNAIKSGSPEGCPDRSRAACAGVVLRAAGRSCADFAAKAEKAYCSYLVSKDKEEERRIKSEEDKAETARKKEEQKLMEEQNKQIKKMLGR